MFTTNIKDVASVRVSLMILDWSLLEPSNRVAKVVCVGELATPQPPDKNHEMRPVREAAPGINIAKKTAWPMLNAAASI